MGLLAMAGGFYARVSLRAIAESVPAPAEPGQNNVQGHMNQSQHAS
jgi:hypothetical protein